MGRVGLSWRKGEAESGGHAGTCRGGQVALCDCREEPMGGACERLELHQEKPRVLSSR